MGGRLANGWRWVKKNGASRRQGDGPLATPFISLPSFPASPQRPSPLPPPGITDNPLYLHKHFAATYSFLCSRPLSLQNSSTIGEKILLEFKLRGVGVAAEAGKTQSHKKEALGPRSRL
ncbi:hypothetical protein E2C01_057614 [Portunus trituberculatus]|uniref:Uncharacterized protein n=1 Tax=Portunus trituberculatus TaxID=210409 RepID=A0A5B7H0Z3_PORTR|nr:hypothetical protein [Portunus trituberculatus]